jgi:hypothetical protein
MKNIKSIALLAFTALFMVTQAGCFGKFGLTRKVYNFNSKVGDKWVNELVFLVFLVVPVYEISGFIDIVFLNLIEFWSGSNPVTMAPGKTETQLVKVAGKSYNLTASHNRFHFESVDKKFIQDLVYNEKTKTWAVVTNNKSIDVCTYNSDGSVTVYKANHTNSIYTTDALKKMAENTALAFK